jgi:hypothetical protein
VLQQYFDILSIISGRYQVHAGVCDDSVHTCAKSSSFFPFFPFSIFDRWDRGETKAKLGARFNPVLVSFWGFHTLKKLEMERSPIVYILNASDSFLNSL